MQELDVNNQDITVTSDQLRHVRDTLIRTDSALKKAKVSALQYAEEMHAHQSTMREAMVVVDTMIYANRG